MEVINQIDLNDIEYAVLRVDNSSGEGKLDLHYSKVNERTDQRVRWEIATDITIPCLSFGAGEDFIIVVSEPLVKLLKYATMFRVLWNSSCDAMIERDILQQTVIMELEDDSEIRCNELRDSKGCRMNIPEMRAVR